MSKRVVISVSSEIGFALASQWLAAGHAVCGTYRTSSPIVDRFQAAGGKALRLDLADVQAGGSPVSNLLDHSRGWDVTVFAAGSLDPIGPFVDCPLDRWIQSLQVNFVGQLALAHRLLPLRRRDCDPPPLLLFFAGGGTNGSTPNFSAYTLSKIGLIKMCELLDAELPDIRCAILGPGWVRTKIHHATLRAKATAGGSYEQTATRLRDNNFVPMSEVLRCCEWLVQAPKPIVGGRNFSLVHDAWGSAELDALLLHDPDMYKLRRAGNSRLVRE